MIRLLADESVSGVIIRQLRRRLISIDLLTAHDAGLRTADDESVLEWAAEQGRVVITADRDTMIGYAYARVASGKRMPGLLVAGQKLPVGLVVEDLLTIAGASEPSEWESQVVHLPL